MYCMLEYLSSTNVCIFWCSVWVFLCGLCHPRTPSCSMSMSREHQRPSRGYAFLKPVSWRVIASIAHVHVCIKISVCRPCTCSLMCVCRPFTNSFSIQFLQTFLKCSLRWLSKAIVSWQSATRPCTFPGTGLSVSNGIQCVCMCACVYIHVYVCVYYTWHWGLGVILWYYFLLL